MSDTIIAPEMNIEAATEIPETKPFVHLHCHSHYSLLDGAGDIGKLVKRAVDHGMNALALTDHGNLHGALEFYRKAKDAGINPIIGYEAYIAPGSRFDKGGASSSKAASYHLTLLAQNRTGFKNLIKLASAASLEGFYFKPRIDKEILEKYNEGIVCLSGCVSSEFSRAILKGIQTKEHEEEAKKIAGWFHKVFGDRYFIEIMNNDVDIQRTQLEGAVDIANKMGLPLVATSDCHYVNQEDAEAQDIMLCINTGRFRTDNTRMKMENDQFFLRSPQQMYEKFPGLEDAVGRSQEIADTVDIQLEFNKYFFPSFPCPDELTPLDYLRKLCEQGLMERYEGDDERIIDGKLSDEVMARLDRELDVIEKLGYPTYFLIVWDFVNHARDIGISATARGSGVGAIVCYALYMSHVCPLRYDLLFERFLDESRTEPPDIDIDFEKERRIEVIDYVKERYGSEMVCQIGTFGTLAAKAAIKDTGRALGIPLSRVNQITELVPDELKITIAKSLEKSADLKMIYDGDPEIRELLDLAMKIEGLARNVGTHAAAVVIADKPLTEYVPLGRVPGKQDVITQWAMVDVEASGLLKMDFLGLRNLTILSRTVKLVEQTTGTTIDPLKFPLDDKPSYALLQRGETKGVFQLESGGIRDLLQRMKPDTFNDIIATAALYRPGPLEGGMVDDYVNIKHGRQQPEYKHPVLKEILEETNSIMVYQEQVMRILNRVGNVELASAYKCIKAISKKKQSIIDSFHDDYINGAKENGISTDLADELWNLIVAFAGYGFNKSHSTAYGLIAYETAYLKAHYPVEFMAALLSCGMESTERISEHVDDARRQQIAVLAPDVNRSEVEFGIDGKNITFGMGAIKGVGEAALHAIVAEREENGTYTDIFDLTERVDSKCLTKGTLETLVKVGALDSLPGTRAQQAAVVERAVQAAVASQKDKASGQMNLFGGDDDPQHEDEITVSLPDVPDWTHSQKLAAEKEALGFYLTSHPLSQHSRRIARYAKTKTRNLADLDDGENVTVTGMVGAIKIATSKKANANGQNRYANFDLEDPTGIVRCIAWPADYSRYESLIKPESIIVVQGRVDRRGREPNLIVNRMFTLDDADREFTTQVAIKFEQGLHTHNDIETVHRVIQKHPGSTGVILVVDSTDPDAAANTTGRLRYILTTSANCEVSVSPDFRQDLTDSIGEQYFEFKVGKF